MADTSGSADEDARPPPAPQPPLDVLTVGDGNFSFSLAFLRQQIERGGRSVRLVATSYDSYEELVAKYPEAVRICAQLRELGATLLHRVDATNLQVSLGNAQGAASVARVFDRIVFNHPHCGEENVQRHQSLLSHFYASATHMLRKEGGSIHLMLAEGQPERWEARERALKAGLQLVRQVDDVDDDHEFAVAYERKRHQNGKSFHRVLLHGERKEQSSTLFIFERGVQAVEQQVDRKRKRSLTDGTAAAAVSEAKVTKTNEPDGELKCEPCAKTFKTAQGLKTHAHMVHELRVAGAAKSTSSLPCGHCDRTFKNDDARRQHEISKHGNDASIQPDWYTRRVRSASASHGHKENEESTTCSTCGFSFPDAASFDAHWKELRPKAVERRVCTMCHRSFEEERALRQHQNFCRLQAGETEDKKGLVTEENASIQR